MRPQSTPRTCPVCGDAVPRNNITYCSRACKSVAQTIGETRACIECGITIYVHANRKTPGKWCRACYLKRAGKDNKGRAKSLEHRANLSAAKSGKPNLKLRKPPISRTCLHCQHEFAIDRSRPNRDSARFCNTACWYEYIRQHPEEHSRYRGGRFSRVGRNWPSQSRKARKRDNYTCQRCGHQQRQPALDVHHIVPRRVFGDDWESANRLDNLVTLCKRCHMHIESLA